MKGEPDNIDDLSKVLDDNIRRRAAQPFLSGAIIINLPFMVVDHCVDCGLPSSQLNDNCTCPCHPRSENA